MVVVNARGAMAQHSVENGKISSTDMYIGSMRLNASHGVGMLLQADGSVSSGIWKDGKFLG